MKKLDKKSEANELKIGTYFHVSTLSENILLQIAEIVENGNSKHLKINIHKVQTARAVKLQQNKTAITPIVEFFWTTEEKFKREIIRLNASKISNEIALKYLKEGL